MSFLPYLRWFFILRVVIPVVFIIKNYGFFFDPVCYTLDFINDIWVRLYVYYRLSYDSTIGNEEYSLLYVILRYNPVVDLLFFISELVVSDIESYSQNSPNLKPHLLPIFHFVDRFMIFYTAYYIRCIIGEYFNSLEYESEDDYNKNIEILNLALIFYIIFALS